MIRDRAKTTKGRKQPKSTTLRPIHPSKKAEKTYRRALLDMVTAVAKVVRDTILPVFGQASAAGGAGGLGTGGSNGFLSGGMAQSRTVLASIMPDVLKVMEQVLTEETGRHRKEWIRAVFSSTGIDLSKVIADEDLAEEFGMMLHRNATLIKSLSEDVQHRIERAVAQAVIDGTRPEVLAKSLREQFGITQRRAMLIARDQISKATSDLTRLRQEQAGIESYRWSTSLDERVRGRPASLGGKYPNAKPSHWAREGKVFKWSDPPADGHPGKPVNCRCVALGVIKIDY